MSTSENKATPPSRWRMLWIVPPILIGIIGLVIAKNSREAPAKSAYSEPSRAVRYIEVPKLALIPTAEGYGAVAPERTWSAVAQVSGRVVDSHPRLHNGEIIPAGTVLMRIDPVDYELALAQSRAELKELDMQAENALASLNIEKRNLSLAEREMRRMQKLAKQGTTSQSSADSAERTMLSTRTAVQNLENTLALIPSQRAVYQARVVQAERDLQHTRITAPFNLRIDKLSIETDQYVTQNQVMFTGEAVDRIEITAQIAISSLRTLFIDRKIDALDMSLMNETLKKNVGFHPTVELDLGDTTAHWDARFVRFSGDVDVSTRTMGIVVAVDKPFSKVIPGYRPPLSKGMFVKVTLHGNAGKDRLVVPRSAVRGNRVYIVDKDNRLQQKTVELLFQQENISVIKSGLEAGERVITTDIVPAVVGMLLLPSLDEQMQQQLVENNTSARAKPGSEANDNHSGDAS